MKSLILVCVVLLAAAPRALVATAQQAPQHGEYCSCSFANGMWQPTDRIGSNWVSVPGPGACEMENLIDARARISQPQPAAAAPAAAAPAGAAGGAPAAAGAPGAGAAAAPAAAGVPGAASTAPDAPFGAVTARAALDAPDRAAPCCATLNTSSTVTGAPSPSPSATAFAWPPALARGVGARAASALGALGAGCGTS